MKAGPGIKGHAMKSKTNFDEYLAEQLRGKDFAGLFKKAGQVWDPAVRLASSKKTGVSPKGLPEAEGKSR
jgi:hypothetical protein